MYFNITDEDEDEIKLMEELFRGIGASEDVIKKAKEEYKAIISFYNSLTPEQKELERKSMEMLTENMTFDTFETLSNSEKESYMKRVRSRLQVN
tara:strand:- start:897 stop:1178 length:282 start_codon:yes stop_codon:yes gene_type:complete